MSRNKIEDYLNSVLTTYFEIPADKVKPSASLRAKDGLHLEESDISDLAMYLEENFVISIPEEHEDKWITLKDVVDYVEKKAAE